MNDTTYDVIETAGYAVVRDGGDLAEFLDLGDAHEAASLLERGEKSEADYEWYTP